MDILRLTLNRMLGRQTRLHVDVLGTPLVLRARAVRELRRARAISQEAGLIRRMISFMEEGDVVYDVGANIGIIALVLARHGRGEGARVHCFEPEARNFEQLVGNIDENGLADRVSAHRAALGDREGDVALFVRGGPGEGRHSVAEPSGSDGSVQVRMHTASGFARRIGAAPQMVKIDVEGAEGRVLAGFGQLMKSEPPREVFLEIHDKGDRDRMPDGTSTGDWLSALGYTLVWKSERGRTGHRHYRRAPQEGSGG